MTLEDDWANRARCGEAYVVVLSVDRDKVMCLCPSRAAPCTQITAATISVPDDAPDKCLEVKGPTGEQSVLALLTHTPFEESIYAGLRDKVHASVLNRLATQLSPPEPTEWQLLKKEYEVW